MGWGKSLMGIARKVSRPVLQAGRVANKIPGMKYLGPVGAVLGGAGILSDVVGSFDKGPTGGFGGGLPALPGGFPGMPGPGDRGILRNDPNVVEALKGFAISKAGLRVGYRAPKGFVVMRDQNGDPFGIPKALARKYLGYKDAAKPPMSASEWNSLKSANRVVKKLKKMNSMAKKVANFGVQRPKMIDMSRPKFIPIKGRRVA